MMTPPEEPMSFDDRRKDCVEYLCGYGKRNQIAAPDMAILSLMAFFAFAESIPSAEERLEAYAAASDTIKLCMEACARKG